jgi:predicted ATPase
MKAAQEALAERLVTDLGDGRFSFAHALVRDTLYHELSPAKRAALHECTGLAIEAICGDDVEERLGELAHHVLEAAPRTRQGDRLRAPGSRTWSSSPTRTRWTCTGARWRCSS